MKKHFAVLVLSCLSSLGFSQTIVAPHAQIFRSGGNYMGVGVVDVTSENMNSLKLKEERGVEVISVSPESPAAKAGLKEHDAILDYNGTRIESVEQFKRMISETPTGRTVKLMISRDGATQTLTSKVEGRSNRHEENNWVLNMPAIPAMPAMPATPATPTAPPAPAAPRAPRARAFTLPNFDGDFLNFNDNFFMGNMPRLGIAGEEVGAQLGEFFGVPDKQGVLVREVSSGSAAEKAGIKAGDVIVKIDGKKVQDMSDLREAVRDNQGKSFPVQIIRNKKEMTLTVKIERAANRSAEHVEL